MYKKEQTMVKYCKLCKEKHKTITSTSFVHVQ